MWRPLGVGVFLCVAAKCQTMCVSKYAPGKVKTMKERAYSFIPFYVVDWICASVCVCVCCVGVYASWDTLDWSFFDWQPNLFILVCRFAHVVFVIQQISPALLNPLFYHKFQMLYSLIVDRWNLAAVILLFKKKKIHAVCVCLSDGKC